MTERALKKRLMRVVLGVLAAAAAVLLVSVFVFDGLNESLRRSVQDEMRAETREYITRINNQIEKDFQTLGTLAAFMKNTSLTEPEEVASLLYDANYKNDFVTMSYFGTDGVGAMAHLQMGLKTDVNYRSLPEQSREVIEDAFAGHRGVSRLFYSEMVPQNVYIYAMPVRVDNEVVGVLAASDHVEIFENELNNGGVFSGKGAAILLDSSGTVMITEHNIKTGANIVSEEYFSESDMYSIQDVLNGNAQNTDITLKYKDNRYNAYIEPVGIQDWYLMCVHDRNASSSANTSFIKTLAFVFSVLMALVLLLLYLVYKTVSRSNKELTKLAFRDRLTNADNMLKFEERYNEAIKHHTEGFAVIAINVHQFKFINEIFGKEVADKLLGDISACIEKECGENEFFARDSADKFYIFTSCTDKEAIHRHVKSIMENVHKSVNARRDDYQFRLYSGAYIHNSEDDPETEFEIMMTRATFAMNYCKTLPQKKIYFYDADIHKDEELENYIESHMHLALTNGEFRLYLQPKKNLNTNVLGGAEALVRWITKDGTMIFPNDFIPQFEKNGFCVQLDMYMTEKVFEMVRSWIDMGIEPIPVSINQSKLLFFRSDYIDCMRHLLNKYKIPAKLITIEILEGVAMDHIGAMNEKIRALHNMGFLVSMDDFGSGYSSFNTLGNIEIDELKLDRGFLLEASKGKSTRFRTIMKTVINLAKKLNIQTVTEGVETRADEEFIRGLGCDFGQGYLYSKPISEQEFFVKYMEDRKIN